MKNSGFDRGFSQFNSVLDDSIGNKVICVKRDDLMPKSINVGGVYIISDVIKNDDNYKFYKISIEHNSPFGYFDSRFFKLISELREEKLKELGI